DEFGLGHARGLELRGREQRQGEDDDEPDPDRPRSFRDQRGDPTPYARAADARRGGARLRLEAPENGPTDGHERGGQERQCGQDRHGDADRRDRSEGAGGGEVGEQEDQEAGDDGAAGGEDRLEHASERLQPRTDAIAFGQQGIAEAGDDAERVVGRRADDEDEQDALDLPVDEQDLGIGQMPDDEDRRRQCSHRGEEDDDRQQRGPVDDDEDDEDRDEGDEQQDPV